MNQSFINLGIALHRLEKAKVVTAKNFLLKHNPAQSGDGFMRRSEDAMRVSNDLTEMAAQNEVASVLSMCPLLSAGDLESYSPEGVEEKAAFFEGFFQRPAPVFSASDMGRKGGAATSPAKIETARENGKKGGRPRKEK